MVRVSDFSVRSLRRTSRELEFLIALSLFYFEESGNTMLVVLAKQYDEVAKNFALSQERARLIRVSSFNLNYWTDEMALRDFRFKKTDIALLCDVLSWPQDRVRTIRSRYKFDPLEAKALLLHRLATTGRIKKAEMIFETTQSALSEIFMSLWSTLNLRSFA